jgi:hypothetical protein
MFENEKFSDRVLVWRLLPPAAPADSNDASTRPSKKPRLSADVKSLDEEVTDVKDPADAAKAEESDGDVKMSSSSGSIMPNVVKRLAVNSAIIGAAPVCVLSSLAASQSDVFKTMLTSGMREGSEKELFIDVKSESEMQLQVAMVRFFYTAQLPSDAKSNDLVDLMLIANKFQVKGLISACSAKICSALTVELAFAVVELPEKLQLSDACDAVVSAGKRAIVNRFKVRSHCSRSTISTQDLESCMESKEFERLRASALLPILQRFDIRVVSDNPTATNWQSSRKTSCSLQLFVGLTRIRGSRRK